ncbi:patatin-like phospholipase family protein [Bdellovibrio sp. ArHS]|uniref:patatin-like phospholipase family protein n=1 Tax=Bdellovibrio sp. ArHS TaxID=1569284 RepID=UPI000B08420A|nr:patatin-like phospholipase family protein [Bdellovibrio sp. ArHS]
MPCLGLVLSGGGARGAYQAGVLAAIAHVANKLNIRNPFQIYSGVSAGAINVCMLAGHSGDFVEGARNLVSLWSHITSDQVFYADLMALSRGGLQWMSELSLGGGKSETSLRSLLSTHPLNNFISDQCHFDQIEKKIKTGNLRAISVSALDYDSVSTVTFYQGAADILPWERGMHRSEKAVLTTEHVMASSAIPLLFPPIKIGERYFGDGCIRNQSPCGPAIYMGADSLIAIGVRRRQDTWYSYHHNLSTTVPTVSRVANVLMNAVMMDGFESDVNRLEQINQGFSSLTSGQRKKSTVRKIDYLWISPSVDFSEIAKEKGSELPRMIRYLLRGPGSMEESREMLSYLLFTPHYCKQLVDIGFSDGMKEKDRIEELIVTKAAKPHSVKHHANSRSVQ